MASLLVTVAACSYFILKAHAAIMFLAAFLIIRCIDCLHWFRPASRVAFLRGGVQQGVVV